MYRIFDVILLLDAFVLLVAVLLQAGRGGGLASSFGGGGGGDQLFGARQAGNLLTRTTWWSAGIFLGLAFIMQLYAGRGNAPTSILDRSFAPVPASKAPASAPAKGADVPGNVTLPLPLPTDKKAPDAKAPDAKKGDTKQPEPAKKP